MMTFITITYIIVIGIYGYTIILAMPSSVILSYTSYYIINSCIEGFSCAHYKIIMEKFFFINVLCVIILIQ